MACGDGGLNTTGTSACCVSHAHAARHVLHVEPEPDELEELDAETERARVVDVMRGVAGDAGLVATAGLAV